MQKKIRNIVLAALVLTSIIFIIEINIDSNTITFTKSELNEILLSSFIRGLVISVAVTIGNQYKLE